MAAVAACCAALLDLAEVPLHDVLLQLILLVPVVLLGAVLLGLLLLLLGLVCFLCLPGPLALAALFALLAPFGLDWRPRCGVRKNMVSTPLQGRIQDSGQG